MDHDLQDPQQHQLSNRDWALLLSLTAVWLVCLVLNLGTVFGDGEYLAAFVPTFDRTEDGTPVVVSLVADREQGGEDLAIGDRLIALNGQPLAEVTPMRFQFMLANGFSEQGKVDFLVERDSEQIPISIRPSTSKISWSHLPPVIGYAGIAILVLLRAPKARGTRLFFVAFMTLAIFQTIIASGSGYQVVAGRLFFIFMAMVAFTLLVMWLITFPRPPIEDDPKPRVPIWVAFIVPILFPLPRLSYYFNGPLAPENYVLQTYSIDMLFTLLVIAILGWNYWCVDPANRRKIRWVLIGVYLAFVPIAIIQFAGALFELGDWFLWLQSIGLFFYVAVPLSLFIAMRHFNLFDVDRVISGSVLYTALIVLFALLAEGLFEPLAASMATNFGAEADTGQFIFVGLLAALAIPIQSYLRPKVNHLFFRSQSNFRDSIDDLINEVASTGTKDLEKVALLIGSRLSEVLEVKDCAIYLYEDEKWTPVFHFGTNINLALEGNQAQDLKQLFDRSMVPIRLKQGSDKEMLLADRFTGLDAELIVPFRSANDGCGFLCLGRKRSKDVYTNTDVTLLAGVAVQIALSYS
ncbi:MAG: hypothetical protein ACI82A_002065 [Candidatus Azotimanducaceae bacterium]